MINHTPAKVDSYDAYLPFKSDGFEWECSCGDSSNDYGTFVEAYDDLKQHCDTANEQLANEQLIVDVSVKLLDVANHKKNHQYDFMALAKHVLENGYNT